MTNSLLQHFYTVGITSSIIIALLLSFVIFNSNKNKNSLLNILAFILIAFSLSTAANSLLATYIANIEPSTQSVSDPFQLLIGPLYYFYLCHLCQRKINVLKQFLHFIPFIFAVLLTLLTISNRLGFFQINFMAMAAFCQIWFYYFLCRVALASYREYLKKTCSSIDKINEAWVSQSLFILLVGYSALSLVYLLNHGIHHVPINQSIAFIFSLVTFFIVYKILIRPELFSKNSLASPVPVSESGNDLLTVVEVDKSDKENGEGKYKKSSLTNEKITQTYQLLKKHMDKEKPYIDPELNLQSLAIQLKVSVHHLSQVINHNQDNNFYDLINSYRIVEVKKQLADLNNSDQSILSIAFNSGFNSKATFNRIFKNIVNQTPSQYRKSQQKNN